MKSKNGLIYYLTVILIIIFSLGPIVWCFILSITPEGDLLKQGTNLIPNTIIWDNYKQIFDLSSQEHQTTFIGLSNSIKIAAITLAIGVPITVITGYALSIYDFRGKNIFVNLLLLTIVIPVFTTIIPVYNIFRNMNLLDSMFWTSVIYVSSALPLNTWIMMNYFKQMPKELWQAAAMDGFNRRQIFFKIILPLSIPTILTTSLIIFLMAWKQYIIPIILLSSYENRTMTMVMSEFMTRDMIKYGMISACGIIAIIPPAIAAMVFRKFIISNLTSGTIK
ncbi:carbohydrate ABC transporter membrane protein 2, CUT1 family [Peptostreptococcus russellii]|uniref:Carbohydrate ABC transporter membrane protein 2, CUT1 family n=1 Tax=Peptostreptococcus russellii TaxID=215200 RepID=A0A1H8J6L5_9FIRM|nr:carbohydrate ABC transporter permease [Peptostreptococcus russellii]SEN76434.1 carbohydrate ABC transporter membrane protein 2, CUT1 family [Peptostreptococcus russellii]